MTLDVSSHLLGVPHSPGTSTSGRSLGSPTSSYGFSRRESTVTTVSDVSETLPPPMTSHLKQVSHASARVQSDPSSSKRETLSSNAGMTNSDERRDPLSRAKPTLSSYTSTFSQSSAYESAASSRATSISTIPSKLPAPRPVALSDLTAKRGQSRLSLGLTKRSAGPQPADPPASNIAQTPGKSSASARSVLPETALPKLSSSAKTGTGAAAPRPPLLSRIRTYKSSPALRAKASNAPPASSKDAEKASPPPRVPKYYGSLLPSFKSKSTMR